MRINYTEAEILVRLLNLSLTVKVCLLCTTFITSLDCSMEFKIHHKEKLYLAIMTLASLSIYLAIFFNRYTDVRGMPLITLISCYVPMLLALKVIGSLLFIGSLKGNAIKIHPRQFPDIFEILESHSKKLGLKKTPDMYLLQGNGMLNAFATKFVQRDYVVLYSDVLELAYQEGLDAVSFIIGHELGHIKRNHAGFFKSTVLSPARLVPFLGNAYSRACEYTCDNIGYNLCPKGALKGALLLAAGKTLYKKINSDELILNTRYEPKFAILFAELFSTHPALVRRIDTLNQLTCSTITAESNSFISPTVTTRQVEAHR